MPEGKLIVKVDIDKEIVSDLMTRDDYDFLHHDPELLLDRFRENLEEFIDELGGLEELIKWVRWID